MAGLSFTDITYQIQIRNVTSFKRDISCVAWKGLIIDGRRKSRAFILAEVRIFLMTVGYI